MKFHTAAKLRHSASRKKSTKATVQELERERVLLDTDHPDAISPFEASKPRIAAEVAAAEGAPADGRADGA